MKADKRGIPCLVLTLLMLIICLTAYMPVSAEKYSVELSQEEQTFIREHPTIKLGVDPAFIPFEFFDTDGVYKGIAADYIALICKKTGLIMTAAENLTWSEAYEKAVERELDVLPSVSKTKERENYFLFSDSYFTFQRVFFINENNNTIRNFNDLAGRRVAVQTNSSHHGFLIAYNDIELSLYASVPEALQAVSDGREVAFVGNLSTSVYHAKLDGITNLKYITIPTEEPQRLYFAVRNDWPELVSIINKALTSISNEEKLTIRNKWIGIEKEADYSEIIRIAGIIVGLTALVLTVSLIWNYRLNKEITIRKKTQDELTKAKEEAEAAKIEADTANHFKSQFLARMSHEIRTPLNAIMGMAYLVKKTGVTVTQGNYLDKLTQASRNMLGIINDILDFAKIEAGKIELEKVSFNLEKVLLRVTNIISVNVEQKGIEYMMDKDPAIPLFYFGDPTRIEQILINVVNNAVKFTDKGSVSLSVRPVSQDNDLYNIDFCVRDTGIGMTQEQLARLFTPFDQADSSISRRFGGTGLGLSIVKNLTDMMGGKIEVSSTPNEGSAFHILIPLPADRNKEQTERMAADCFHNIRTLALDKSEAVRSTLADCFKTFGIHADYAASDGEALQLINSAEKEDKPYNLLVIDYATPEGGGIEFIRGLKRYSLLRQGAKCLLLVSMTREDLYDEIEKAGIDFGITKPIVPSVLYNSIIEMFHIVPPKQMDAEKKEESLTAPYPYHLLLVEDNKTNQFIAETILVQAGFRITKADNGEEGVKAFNEKKDDLDLILMDIHMPVMDGYAATDLIRGTGTKMPIIAMTADAVMGVLEQCRNHGMDDYVSKPFEPEQLIATILNKLKNSTRKKEEPPPDEPGKEDRSDMNTSVKNGEPEKSRTDDNAAHLLNATDGIKRIGGDIGIYYMILQEYFTENNNVAQALEETIRVRDYPAAVQIVHKIKSSSGNIGAKSMFDAASTLQKSLQAGDDNAVAVGTATFQILLSKLLTEIELTLKDHTLKT